MYQKIIIPLAQPFLHFTLRNECSAGRKSKQTHVYKSVLFAYRHLLHNTTEQLKFKNKLYSSVN